MTYVITSYYVMFYEVLGCVIALREFVQLAEQLMALRGLGHIVCVQL